MAWRLQALGYMAGCLREAPRGFTDGLRGPLIGSSGTNTWPLRRLARTAISSWGPSSAARWRSTALTGVWPSAPASAASPVVDYSISVTIFPVRHSILKMDPRAATCGNVLTVNLTLFRFSEGGVGLEKSLLEILWFRVNRELIYNGSSLAEGICPDNENSS